MIAKVGGLKLLTDRREESLLSRTGKDLWTMWAFWDNGAASIISILWYAGDDETNDLLQRSLKTATSFGAALFALELTTKRIQMVGG